MQTPVDLGMTPPTLDHTTHHHPPVAGLPALIDDLLHRHQGDDYCRCQNQPKNQIHVMYSLLSLPMQTRDWVIEELKTF